MEYKVVIENVDNPNAPWKPEPFATEELADKWIAKHSVLPGRGKVDKRPLNEWPEFILKEKQEQRKKLYPDVHEQLEAIMEEKVGRPEKMQIVLAKIEKVKLDIPIDETLRSKK